MLSRLISLLQRCLRKPTRRVFPARLSFEQRQLVRDLWDDDFTYDDIVIETGVSRRSVARIIKREKDRREQLRVRQLNEEMSKLLTQATNRLREATEQLQRPQPR
ncbi:MAG: hypothetical protein JW395_1919 [Nitrospira sp.]|nr:hypothetical protein [Nitrospira sp.]